MMNFMYSFLSYLDQNLLEIGEVTLVAEVNSRCLMIGHRLHNRSSIPGGAKDFSLFLLCQDWFWGPPSLLCGGYQGLFLLGESDQSTNLSIHLLLVWSLGMYGIIPPWHCISSWHGTLLITRTAVPILLLPFQHGNFCDC